MYQFDLPTLVTITAPTCAGKNHLLEAMVEAGFGRIVSTTDRAPRDGEIEGVHYFFISTEESKAMEARGEFAELITYNGTRYGVPHIEMERKLAAGMPPPIVILEPQGLEIYRKYCGSKNWAMFSIYVETQESIRLERLTTRTATDVLRASYKGGSGSELFTEFQKLIGTNNRRLKSVIEEERRWGQAARWDCIADGTDVQKALEAVARGIKNRNARSDIYK